MRASPLVNLITAPWAILPEKLCEIQAVYAAHVRGELADIAAIEARLGRPLASEQQTYTVDANGVARLDVAGVMAPKANLMMQISGGVSTQLLADQFNSMAADARVRAAAIVWDSPGGNVLGIPAAAAALAQLAAAKPTASLVRGVMASAAYWTGSAANAVLLEGATDVVGSLGVYQRLTWQDPVPNSLELVRGKYKRTSVNGQAPSAEVIAEAESQLDYLYTVLVDAVAQHRGTTADAVLQHMADGRLFTGQMAIDAGLADGMTTVDALLEQLATEPGAFRTRRKARIAGTGRSARLHVEVTAGSVDLPALEAALHANNARLVADLNRRPAAQHGEGQSMSKLLLASALALAASDFAAALADEHPDLAAELRGQGAQAERDRIAAVRAQSMPGHEKLIEQLAFDGKTTGPEAAMQVLAAERATKAAHAKALADDLPAPVVTNATATGDAGDDKVTKPAASPMEDARALSAAIVKKQAEAAAGGRVLTVAQALQEVRKESNHA